MIELSDPLWCKLNSAHGFGEDIPFRLVELAEHWDETDAEQLMYGDLVHQETCYGATYAAAPYLLKIAMPDDNVLQRMDIAVFLGHCALCALRTCEQYPVRDGNVNGLALTLESWEATRDTYRSRLALEQDERASADYREVVDLRPPSKDELRKFAAIHDRFIALLPDIGALCERTFHEHKRDEYIPRYLLSGIAATEKLTELAALLESGEEGFFTCEHCDAEIEYIVFGDRMALYIGQAQPGVAPDPDTENSVLDFQDGEPKRADCLVIAYDDHDDNLEAPLDRLLDLAQQADNPQLETLMRSFLGKFMCTKCEKVSQVCPGLPVQPES